MITHYLKQSLSLLKENPLVSAISILGTALSIAMIMQIVLVFQISVAEYKPESRRNSMLYVSGIEAKAENQWNRTSMSAEMVKECFYSLRTPKAVTAYVDKQLAVSLPGKRMFREYAVKYTDTGFWEVFDFDFLRGAPFTEADFLSAIPRAVVSSEAASRIFGAEEAIGQTIILDFVAYTVTGVVKPVSRKAEQAHAEIWVPYTSNPVLMENPYCEGICGHFQTVMLAHNSSDFGKIREELERQTQRYNDSKPTLKLSYMENPITRLDIAVGSTAFKKVDIKDYFLRTGALLLFLLLVPALNLTGIIQSSIQRRSGEVGVRKVFGATRGVIVGQVLCENLTTTAIGGALGLAFSFLLLRLTEDALLTPGMLLTPGLFLAAFLLVLLLNLLSSGLPAVLISRRKIVDTLKS